MKHTKILFVAFFLLTSVPLLFGQNMRATQSNDPVLMEVDNKKITRSEFLQIYLKNNPDPKYDRQTLDEYIALYKKFQLKVAEAEALGYDTISRLKQELEGYQEQLAQPYLTDINMNQHLVEQAYQRLQKEIRASHILIRLDAHNPDDTTVAYNRALEVRQHLLKGEDFSAVAKKYSQDESVESNQGDLGYFTAFQMVYPFEEAAYTLAVGEISMPIRTKFGYHILKVTDIRDARGTMTAAHLMIAARKGVASPEEIDRAQAKISEIYDKLRAGDNFDSLVSIYSEDPGSSQKGGLLPEFGTGTTTRLLPAFEESAFSLKKNGDFSQPVMSDFGFHIIKRIDWKPLKSFDELKKEIEYKVKNDQRSQLTRTSFIEQLKQTYNYQALHIDKNIQWLSNSLDSSVFQGEFDLTKFDVALEPLFILDNIAYTLADYVQYLNSNPRLLRGKILKDIPHKLYQEWENTIVINAEKQRLFEKYPDYKSLMQEYHDGILLYEIMNDHVWNKAVKDTAGLRAFYQQNKDKYVWGIRYDFTAFQTNNLENAEKTYKLIKKKTPTDSIIQQLSTASQLNIKVANSGLFEVAKIPYLQGKALKKGVNKPYEVNGQYYVVNITKILKPQTKEIYEAKGLITADYQNFLEQTWIEELEKKHTIVVHQDVLYSIGK